MIMPMVRVNIALGTIRLQMAFGFWNSIVSKMSWAVSKEASNAASTSLPIIKVTHRWVGIKWTWGRHQPTVLVKQQQQQARSVASLIDQCKDHTCTYASMPWLLPKRSFAKLVGWSLGFTYLNKSRVCDPVTSCDVMLLVAWARPGRVGDVGFWEWGGGPPLPLGSQR